MTKRYNPRQNKLLLSLLEQLREGLKGSENLRWSEADFMDELQIIFAKPEDLPDFDGVTLRLICSPLPLDERFEIITIPKTKRCAGINRCPQF